MRRGLVLLIVGIAGLAALRVAYVLTIEPAPAIRVRWRPGTTDARRAQLERQYRLVHPDAPEGLSYSYAIADTSQGNIGALLHDPEVDDTADIDLHTMSIPWATEQESREWMWVADRLPVIRQPAARLALIVILSVMSVAGAIDLVRAMWWRSRQRAAVVRD